MKFPQALALLRQWRGLTPLLQEAARFYRIQLHRHGEAVAYLHQRGIRSPELIEHMRIGYAPGGCLRGWLTQLGYPLPALRQAGLVTAAGYDAYMHRIVFPLEGNLYGRSLSASAPPHRFLPGAKGGLYAWEQVRHYPEVILVEGLFDYAVLWQAGFHNVTCSLGTHLNARQFRQLCDCPRTVYLAFDADANGSGQQAAQSLWQTGSESKASNARTRLAARWPRSEQLLRPGRRRASVPVAAGGGSAMKFRVIYQQTSQQTARSPVRVVEQTTGREVGWVNRYLDREYVRRLADTTLRTLCARPAALSPLVGECSSHRRRLGRRSHRIDTAGLCAIPVRPATAALPAPPSTHASPSPIAPCATSFPTLPARSLAAFIRRIWQRAPMGLARPRLA